jgi:AraC family transcriptional regulator
MRPTTTFDYRARIERVLEELTKRLDAEPTLSELAAIACFSPFHFHRIFRAITGETVAALRRRLLLERAARTLRDGPISVMEAALDAGYGSPEAFARAFQQAFAVSPSDYRERTPPLPYKPPLAGLLRLDNQRLTLSLEPATGGTDMDVRIETWPDRLCVCLRHVGPYSDLAPSFQRLLRWVVDTGRLIPNHRIIGLSYDDAESVKGTALRYDVCVTIAETIEDLPSDFRCERIGGGRWAIYTLKGPYSGMDDAFRRLLGRWLPDSGELLDDRPCMEVYLNDPGDVPEAELLTDICIPLRASEPVPK